MTDHFIDLSDFDGATLRGMLGKAKSRNQTRGDLPRDALSRRSFAAHAFEQKTAAA